jgi:hypothetical protein
MSRQAPPILVLDPNDYAQIQNGQIVTVTEDGAVTVQQFEI